MACEIIWSPLAVLTFENNLLYLKNNWTQKEIETFILTAEYYIHFISENPKIFTVSHQRKNIRSVLILKQIRLYYKFYQRKNKIVLLSFFDT